MFFRIATYAKLKLFSMQTILVCGAMRYQTEFPQFLLVSVFNYICIFSLIYTLSKKGTQ